MKTLDLVAVILLIVGGLNWGLVGVADFDLLASIFGKMQGFTRLLYTLIGLSAVYHILQWNTFCKRKR